MNATTERPERVAENGGSRSHQRMVGERQAALLVESALEILNQSHVKDNQWRLGALGNGDIEIVKRYLTSAKEQLSNESSSAMGASETKKAK